MIQFLFCMLIAYLIGSIPTSYIAGRLTRGIDIRNCGSGNVGATNTLRVLGKKMGAAVLSLDMAKGALCVLVLPVLFYNTQPGIDIAVFRSAMAACAVCGHVWTIFLRFKGGKGVATTAGVFLSLSPIAALSAMVVFALILKFSKYVSLSSIIMMASLPVFLLTFRQPQPYVALSVILGILVVYTHRANIKRLLAGNENKIGKKA